MKLQNNTVTSSKPKCRIEHVPLQTGASNWKLYNFSEWYLPRNFNEIIIVNESIRERESIEFWYSDFLFAFLFLQFCSSPKCSHGTRCSITSLVCSDSSQKTTEYIFKVFFTKIFFLKRTKKWNKKYRLYIKQKEIRI